MQLEAGQPAPPFTATDQDGNELTLEVGEAIRNAGATHVGLLSSAEEARVAARPEGFLGPVFEGARERRHRGHDS